jgi:hypothetical protein
MRKRRLTLYSEKLSYIADAILGNPDMFSHADKRRFNVSLLCDCSKHSNSLSCLSAAVFNLGTGHPVVFKVT